MSADDATRVMIVDDHSVLRVGLKNVLERTGEFDVVGQAADGDEAVRVAAELSPDLVVMDVMMPNKDGVQACREIMEFSPATRVVMLTASVEEDAVVEALAAGATGYIQKETGLDTLLSTVRDVARGDLRIPANTVQRVLAGIRNSVEVEGTAEVTNLTRREREILTAFAAGASYAQIAEQREVKPVTVRNAVYGIQNKLKIDTMQGLVLWAAQHGLVNGTDLGSQQLRSAESDS